MKTAAVGIMVGILMLIAPSSKAQTYADSITMHRQQYKQEFLQEERSPLKVSDTGFLRFFPADAAYRVMASLQRDTDTTSFLLPTSSGKLKRFRRYGIASFVLKGKRLKLELYQNLQLLGDTAHAFHLFLPFKDRTNNAESYGGGRYLDLDIRQVDGDRLEIDFNKSYNPWCAYSDGYNCPIPPDANKMILAIRAGEKQFGKPYKH